MVRNLFSLYPDNFISSEAVMSDASLIKATIDLNAKGHHSGYLTAPCPNNESAWGVIKIPITSIKNGDGPTLLLTAGVHGDEYEGPVVLSQLAQLLSHQHIRGQIIIIPTLNPNASLAATRLSPIDHLDMNRSFPGNAHGSITNKITHFVSTELLPKVEYVIDFHSGGRSLEFLPVIIMHDLENNEQREKTFSALKNFGGQFGLILEEIDCVGMFDTYCETNGKIFLTTELSGGCNVNVDSVKTAKSGLRRFLLGVESLTNHDALKEWKSIEEVKTQIFEVPNQRFYLHAEHHGVFEPLVKLGEDVEVNQTIGFMHNLSRVNHDSIPLKSDAKGIIIAKRALAQSVPGDCLFVIGKNYECD
jgi:N2-acetyl-L-2,4-diaminobutanoate deacetylase